MGSSLLESLPRLQPHLYQQKWAVGPVEAAEHVVSWLLGLQPGGLGFKSLMPVPTLPLSPSPPLFLALAFFPHLSSTLLPGEVGGKGLV